MSDDLIPFIVATPLVEEDDTKSMFRGNDDETILKKIPVSKLRESLKTLSSSLSTVFTDIREVGDFKLKTVELQMEVTAEGGVEFIGTTKVGGKGAITLTFSE